MTSVHRRPDRRSPLVLDVLELSHAPGSMLDVSRTVPAPADFGNYVIGVPEGSDVDLDLTLQAVGDGILVSGTVTVDVHGECVRCLRDIDEEGVFDFEELYFYPGREEDEDDSVVIDELIDIEEPMRAAVVLELPFTPLCDENCKGLCPQCGRNLNDEPEHSHGPAIDSRWEKLAGLDVQPDN